MTNSAASAMLMSDSVRKGRELIEKKTADLRKAMGVRKNEANSASICQKISQWENETNLELYSLYGELYVYGERL